jgi:hypothetical protein
MRNTVGRAVKMRTFFDSLLNFETSQLFDELHQVRSVSSVNSDNHLLRELRNAIREVKYLYQIKIYLLASASSIRQIAIFKDNLQEKL